MDIICGGSFGDKRQNTQIHELHCWVLQNDSQGEKLPWRHSFTKIILENTLFLKGVNILSFQFVRLIQMLQFGTKSGFSELPLFKSWHRFYSGGGGMGEWGRANISFAILTSNYIFCKSEWSPVLSQKIPASTILSLSREVIYVMEWAG